MNNSIKNKTILITGATDGIGKQTALELAEMNAKVIIHGRNPNKGRAVLEEIKEKTGNTKLSLYIADFSSLKQIDKLSEELHKDHKKIDVLINNAGVVENSRVLTEDGFEITFAVNHLAMFKLTFLLLDLLQSITPGRIINVSSMAHANVVDFSNLQGEREYTLYGAYSLSKLCNILYTYELADRLKESGITVNCLHPGVISTKLLHEARGPGGRPITEGSETSVYLAISDTVKNITGKYFDDRKIKESSSISYNIDIRKILWELSEKMTGIKY